MKASEIPLSKCLSHPIQYTIPIFQRTYSWTIEQTKQLYSDIFRLATNSSIPMHFLGSLVYIQAGLLNNAIVTELVVIDGQQRLTTITLFLAALAKRFTEVGDEQTAQEIRGHFLINHDTSESQKFKLVLTQNDKDTLMQIIEGKQLINPVSQRIEENYDYLLNVIKTSSTDPHALYDAFKKLMVVDVSLDRTTDNPQLIFESLNSTGLDLSQADLIRNYVLMGLPRDQQNELYRDYWRPMESEFGQEAYAEYFDAFMRDYLTMKTGKIPKESEVYHEFKRYAPNNSYEEMKKIISDVQKFSCYFSAFALGNEKDPDLLRSFTDLVTLKVDVAYPFLLEVYGDHAEHRISKEIFLNIVKLLESYVFRRMICGIPTNSLNKTFAMLSREMDKDQYFDSFQAIMILKTSYRAFPDDEFFKRQFSSDDVYNKLRKEYIFDKLENFGRAERVIVSEYTIEHIMPQNEQLLPEWQQDLGKNCKEIQKIYLHTIGNLTLTAYNSNYSDRPFIIKRDLKDDEGRSIGFASSPFHLNEGLGNLTHWNEEEIKKRAQKLSELAIKIWLYPQVSAEILEKYKKNNITSLDNEESEDSDSENDNSNQSVLSIDDLLSKIQISTARNRAQEVINFCNSLPGTIVSTSSSYIKFKTKNIFASIYPQLRQFWVSIRWVKNDPKHLMQHSHPVYGHVRVDDDVDLHDVFDLIKQAYDIVSR